MNAEKLTQPKLLTVKQTAAAQPAFSEGSLRTLLFNANKNGLDKSGAIVRVGGRVLIDQEKFLNWCVSSAARGKK